MKKIISAIIVCLIDLSFLKAQSPPQPPPPPPILESNNVEIVDTPSLFPGCDQIDWKEKKACAETKMLEFIYGNLVFPKAVKRKKLEGTVLVKFLVKADGNIVNHQVLRDIGEGCAEEALRVIKLMPNWEPATSQGHPIDKEVTLPIRFKLN